MQLLQDYRFPEALDTLQGWKNAIGQPAAGDVSWAMEHSRRMVLLVEEQYCRETESGLSKEELPDTLEACVERCRSLVAKMQESSRTSTFIDTAVCYIRPLQRGPVPGKSGPGGVPVPGVFLPAV